MFSLYLLRFIDESYCRHIMVQLNRGEGRHQLARTIFDGERGELRQRYRKGQKDQLGALDDARLHKNVNADPINIADMGARAAVQQASGD